MRKTEGGARGVVRDGSGESTTCARGASPLWMTSPQPEYRSVREEPYGRCVYDATANNWGTAGSSSWANWYYYGDTTPLFIYF
jgi:hypothetical protein